VFLATIGDGRNILAVLKKQTILAQGDEADAVFYVQQGKVSTNAKVWTRKPIACHIKQRFPSLPIILLCAYSEMPERILWLVDDYVMKSELPERLVPIIERNSRRLCLRGQCPSIRGK
jgi:hypothetical protein